MPGMLVPTWRGAVDRGRWVARALNVGVPEIRTSLPGKVSDWEDAGPCQPCQCEDDEGEDGSWRDRDRELPSSTFTG